MSMLRVDNPFTGNTACELQLADMAAIDRVLERAREGFRVVSAMPLSDRKVLVERAVVQLESKAEDIAHDISRMMGKPLGQARGEVRTMAARARTMIELADAGLKTLEVDGGGDGITRRIQKRPLGVVLDLPAWNYPLLTAVNVVMPAVLAGNAVIVKHSPRSPLCGGHFAQAFVAAGADPRIVQSLDCTHELTEKMIGDPRIDHVVYTGSVFGGRRISQAGAGRFLHIGYELGGSDAAYVAEDADVARAVENLVDGAMYNAGQSCCAVERVYVHAKLYDAFVQGSEALVRAYVLGDPLVDATNLGPIAQPNHVEELEGLVRDAVRGGGQLITGGARCDVAGRGRFFQPTMLTGVRPDARVLREEQFGPILAVQRVESDAQAIERTNDSDFGLTASIWTSDPEHGAKIAEELNVGTVFVNRCDYVDPRLPWSGVKLSGRGHSLSVLGFDALTRPRALHFKP